MALSLTERQYELLRTYEHGYPSWRGGISGTTTHLVHKGFLCDEGRSGFHIITAAGHRALAEFRTKYGLPAGV